MITDKYGNKWFKGNTHIHTTNSDGKFTPEAAKQLYKDHGYDFIALTEHWKITPAGEFDGMTLLSGCEYHINGRDALSGICHIVAVGFENIPDLTIDRSTEYTPQELIDAINAAGGAAIYAHPAWSINRVEMLLPLKNMAGVEIYNAVSDQPVNSRAFSEWIIDLMATNGNLVGCVAADDTHWYAGEECRSAIMIRAEDNSQASIIAAIKRGEYYATQAPTFTYEVWRDRIIIDCSPVSAAVFQSNAEWAPNRQIYGENLTHLEYTIGPRDRFVRFELIDAHRNIAWSSPIDVTAAAFENAAAFEYHNAPAPSEFRTDGTVRP
ncbi:MAG: hypothetical protein IJC94_07060 [Oscillospiraceae bacterium]|nr:hypothetical protein [Oscillospiraceae bacterium]